jgi:hypothetical protein
VLLYAIVFLNAQQFLSWKRGYDEEEGLLNKYVSVFLGYQMLLPIFLIGLYGISHSLEVVGGLQLIYTLYLVIARPYFLKVQNVLLILCQIGGLAFTGLLISDQYLYISEQNMTYTVIVVEGLLAGVSIIAFVRLYLHSKHN